jgi:hypothetical protein
VTSLAATLHTLRDRPACALGLLAVAIHLYASGGYGYFRDELYFIVCGRTPDWGYVDQPPLIAAAMDRWFAPSLVRLRLVPALAHGATIGHHQTMPVVVGQLLNPTPRTRLLTHNQARGRVLSHLGPRSRHRCHAMYRRCCGGR